MSELVLALDISTTVTGYVIMNKDLDISDYGQFNIADRDLTDIQYATVITEEVFKLIKQFKITALVIEDVYFGKNVGNLKTWCRVHGGVGMSWAMKYNEPIFMMAVEARRRTGFHGQATKIEIQLEVANMYGLVQNSTYIAYRTQLDDLTEKRKSKKLTKNQFDYRIKKISKTFEEETGVSEHIGDAVLLARAYFQKIGETANV